MPKRKYKTTPFPTLQIPFVTLGGYFNYSTSLIERLRRFRCLNVSPKSFGLSEAVFKGFKCTSLCC